MPLELVTPIFSGPLSCSNRITVASCCASYNICGGLDEACIWGATASIFQLVTPRRTLQKITLICSYRQHPHTNWHMDRKPPNLRHQSHTDRNDRYCQDLLQVKALGLSYRLPLSGSGALLKGRRAPQTGNGLSGTGKELSPRDSG